MEPMVPWSPTPGTRQQHALSQEAQRPNPQPQPCTRRRSKKAGGGERRRGRVARGLGNGETNSIFCSAVAGGLLRPTGSQSEAISERHECLFFPGAEAKKPRKPSVSLPLISCFEKCRHER